MIAIAASILLQIASQPSVADVLRIESDLMRELHGSKAIGYPEFEKPPTGEQPVSIVNLRCDGGDCSYDVIVALNGRQRSVHRPDSTFCQNPDNVWVKCVS